MEKQSENNEDAFTRSAVRCQGGRFFRGGLRCALVFCRLRQNLQTTVEGTQTGQDLKIQQLQDKLEEIQKELIELKRSNSAQPETHHITTAKASVARAESQ